MLLGQKIKQKNRDWDKSPSLSIVFGLSSKTQWLSGLYYADFISFYSPTQLCGGGTAKSNSNELPISVPLSILIFFIWCQNHRDNNWFALSIFIKERTKGVDDSTVDRLDIGILIFEGNADSIEKETLALAN